MTRAKELRTRAKALEDDAARLRTRANDAPIGKIADVARHEAAKIPVDRSKTTLTDGSPVTDEHREIDPATGQQKGYVVLSEEERAKGFVRPVRRSYIHDGREICGHDLGPWSQPNDFGYVSKICGAPKGHEGPHGDAGDRPVFVATQPELDRLARTGRYKGCGAVTTMSQPLAETYARDPSFYGGTMCATCRKHFPVGIDGEFSWADNPDQKVGT
jgi:hypothetical protein